MSQQIIILLLFVLFSKLGYIHSAKEDGVRDVVSLQENGKDPYNGLLDLGIEVFGEQHQYVGYGSLEERE